MNQGSVKRSKNKDDYISEASVFSIVFQILIIITSICAYAETQDALVALSTCICLALAIITLYMQIRILSFANYGSDTDNITNKDIDNMISLDIILVLVTIVIAVVLSGVKFYYLGLW